MTDPSILYFQELLSPKGIFYLVTVEENIPEDIASMLKTHGIHGKVSDLADLPLLWPQG